MQVIQISSGQQLLTLANEWNCLSDGIPFRSFSWAEAWWRHYGPQNRSRPAGEVTDSSESAEPELFVLAVRDERGQLVGVAPWQRCRSASRGRVVRFLGSGEVCSEYQTILTTPQFASEVNRAIADYLCGPASGQWDLLELAAVKADDANVTRLVRELARRDHRIHRRKIHNCWRLELPESWDDYLKTLSKSHRKQLRRLQDRVLDTDRTSFHSVSCRDSLNHGWGVLVDLHQRRRNSLGEPGCFASRRFAAFHREIAEGMLASGQLRLDYLLLDGKPVAAEYHLAGDGIVYGYQAGVDPDRLDDEPGRLISIALLRKAIEDGCSAIDFLRGDEPYKAHYRAEPRDMVEFRVVPSRLTPQLRHQVWLAGNRVKCWARKA